MVDWSRKIGIDDYPEDALPTGRKGHYLLDDVPEKVLIGKNDEELMYEEHFSHTSHKPAKFSLKKAKKPGNIDKSGKRFATSHRG